MTSDPTAGFPHFHMVEGSSFVAHVPIRQFDIARMTLGPEFDDVDGNTLVIGRTIEVSEAFSRRVLLDLSSGAVLMDDYRNSTLAINSSVDRLVSSLHLYESWHQRLIRMPYQAALIEQRIGDAARELQLIDPGENENDGGGLNWWHDKVMLIQRLI